ncbi:bifunctional hydroxymethylpyrimidine kinase/phosphomethylpyrimidine kinase [Halobellus clavatus]|uniref:Hydroxymethylpyrimidine/phosphomethylpyrimidine kinase n=1 Tax=Halobellus clavatus TaxID=660517 RepID=A0A1H3H834_9EURY|nr:bifunctional hydroxymethylpyrimidine kinase/phosphomethylpyrimidine kinase [Halobellus clavatus]SDY11510.1 hydroxymethylpyrimidine/phosphomethylpyrimidine kinase [Halobellus clavatus]
MAPETSGRPATEVRRPAPVSLPTALTIAGSDSGGGAGIQADLRTMAAHDTFPTSVVTSVTAQHTRGVDRSTVLDEADVRAQYEAVVDDFDVGAAKTGMLGTAEIVRTVSDCLATADFPVVVDPVMVATSGDRLLSRAGERAYEDLLSAATVVTPNRREAAVLVGDETDAGPSARSAGERLVELGAHAALVTDGHGAEDTVCDVLVTTEGVHEFEHPRIDTEATHGTGCSLSAAVAANLSTGLGVEAAVAGAIDFVARAVRYPLDVGQGAGAVHPLAGRRNRASERETVASVRDLVRRFVDADVSPLVPEVGMNVAGATPYAESTDEVAAVEGRLTRTMGGVEPTAGVRFGASSHLARFLLAARDHEPSLRFATNCRLSSATREGLASLDAPVEWFDRTAEPEDASTMDWAADRVFGRPGESPRAVADEGAVGKEPMIRVVGATPDEVAGIVGHLRGVAARGTPTS